MLTLRARVNAQDGFTLVEVAITALVVAVGLIAVLDAVVQSGRLTHGSQRREQAIAYAQSQVEQIRSLDFDTVALTTTPVHGASGNASPSDPHPRNPNFYVQDGPPACLRVKESYRNQVPAGNEPCERFVVDPGGQVAAGPTAFNADGTSGTVYRYVTATPGGCYGLEGITTCLDDSGAHLRRITVAVLLDSSAAPGGRKPIYVSSLIADPETCPLAVCP